VDGFTGDPAASPANASYPARFNGWGSAHSRAAAMFTCPWENRRMSLADRLLIVLAALAGGAGVALSAAAAHAAGGASLDTAARFLLIHAAAIIGVVALCATGIAHPTLGRIAAWTLLLGVALFAGDLSMRALKSTALFPMAAPAGGIGLMIGWGLLALSALVPRS
jgi:uncharacterized membrane protein YgdD (TMEM256/DUF423 family)